MKAIVCVKQVPDTQGKVAVKADGTMDRSAMATITNPDDLNAVEAALQLKDETGCEVVVVTMGPPPAEGMLRELMARGADRGVLVSGREFGGSDTFATSQILAAAVNKIGVGAAFDYHAGVIRRAPQWMQDIGLEWLHRFWSEPRRLGPPEPCPTFHLLP